ncbi:MAG: helix-turn-helix domain-containing protein [Nostocaceae cyanobacterium]|nr:helix-turn-helix domain-containing protein [Nostocaceae cyanobacterium]
MAKNDKAKNLARKLFYEGKGSDTIAQHCGVSRRTIQRWIGEFKQAPVTITTQGETTATESFQTIDVAKTSPNDAQMSPTILPELEKIATLKPDETLDLTITSRMAIRLLNVTEKAIASIEDCLTNPDTRQADKLKAAQIVGNWVGLNSKYGSALDQVSRIFDLNSEAIDTSTGVATVVPEKLLKAREKEIRRYNMKLSGDFFETKKLPNSLDEKNFDLDVFLGYMRDLDAPNYNKGYPLYTKAKDILRSRGYDID